MDISIIKWSEGFYDHYMKILKGETVIYYGENYNIISCKDKDFGLELNYGLNKGHNVYLRKERDKVYTIPDDSLAFKYDYIYIPIEFNMDEIRKITITNPKIKKGTIEEIVLEWILTSNFKDYCTSMEEYKKLLSRNIYYISEEKLNKNIEKTFIELFNKNKGIIEEIDNSKCEVIDVYLDNGNIWEAFLKKNNEIYLNTGLSVTVKI